jgi:hypothetical protein
MDHARDLQAVQKAVGYRFRDPALLRQALTHRSFVHEHLDSRPSDNETLEFLGDAVLGLAVSRKRRKPCGTDGIALESIPSFCRMPAARTAVSTATSTR